MGLSSVRFFFSFNFTSGLIRNHLHLFCYCCWWSIVWRERERGAQISKLLINFLLWDSPAFFTGSQSDLTIEYCAVAEIQNKFPPQHSVVRHEFTSKKSWQLANCFHQTRKRRRKLKWNGKFSEKFSSTTSLLLIFGFSLITFQLIYFQVFLTHSPPNSTHLGIFITKLMQQQGSMHRVKESSSSRSFKIKFLKC